MRFDQPVIENMIIFKLHKFSIPFIELQNWNNVKFDSNFKMSGYTTFMDMYEMKNPE